MTASALVSVRDLTKSFKKKRRLVDFVRPWRATDRVEALRGVDIEVGAGELVSVLGPNGAGKTTLLKILATLVSPTSGSVSIDGIDAIKRNAPARDRVGYVLTEERSFFWRISCRDNLRFFAALQGISGRQRERRIEELATLFGLTEHLPRDFMDLSAGQKQRMAIARGLLADPKVVLFDEATRSLDPGRAARLRRIIREILVGKKQKAVLFATHDLTEAEALSDRVVLMHEGKVAASGSYAEVESRVLAVFEEEAAKEDREAESLFGEES